MKSITSNLQTVSTVSSSPLSTPCTSENPAAKKCSATAFLALVAMDKSSCDDGNGDAGGEREA